MMKFVEFPSGKETEIISYPVYEIISIKEPITYEQNRINAETFKPKPDVERKLVGEMVYIKQEGNDFVNCLIFKNGVLVRED